MKRNKPERCERCGEKGTTRHHTRPKRWGYRGRKHVVYLCQHCHNVIEKVINKLETEHSNERRQLYTWQYQRIAEWFLTHERKPDEVCCRRCKETPCNGTGSLHHLRYKVA